MDDPLLVRGFERLGDLLRDRQRFVERDRRRCAMRCDRSSPSTSSITSAMVPPDLFEAVDVRDVRMIQRRRGLPLRAEIARAARASAASDGRQDLDGDLALQLRVGGPIHLAHPAFADLGGDFVGAEAGAGSEGQSLRRGLYGPHGSPDGLTPE